jgi:hypothetical protein
MTTYDRHIEPRVRDHLNRLLRYATGVGSAANRSPGRSDIVDAGRGYIGGALDTLLELGLATEEEYREWGDRLDEELPPTKWVGA